MVTTHMGLPGIFLFYFCFPSCRIRIVSLMKLFSNIGQKQIKQEAEATWKLTTIKKN